MLTRGTRLAVAAVAVAGTVATTAAGVVAPASSASPLTINTVPFTAPPGASLDDPQGVVASAGVVDVSNTEDNVVASLAGTATTTIAGSYEGTGESGDGGPAVAATLDNPTALALDKAGDLYIADTVDNAVREVTADGTIHLIAGNGKKTGRGEGFDGHDQLVDPQGVAVDAKGDVFIADTDDNVVLESTPQGSLSTYAGNGFAGYGGDNRAATHAELSSPIGLAVDSEGNLYIADAGNNVIRRVSTAGIITTVAGDVAADQASGGLGGFSGDGGPATAARLHSPHGVAVDQAGDLFIADTFNNAIRQVTPDGTISTIVNTAGTKGRNGDGGPAASAQLNTPTALAVDTSTDNLYIADTSNNRIRVVTGFAVPSTPTAGPVANAPAHATHRATHRPHH